jgi:DNA-binding NarL/FixJ family response regulator
VRVAGRLARLADEQRGPYLKAAAAFARGRVCVATGQGDARACLHDALEGFARAQLPMETARTRLVLAGALVGRSPAVAVAEAKAALAGFERLEAARYADAAAALLRSLGTPIRTGPKGAGGLTKREAEVLQLIGEGLSNPEIGNRLYITRKTVEHHVGNVLSKLGLRNRAEAAAYATREKISP